MSLKTRRRDARLKNKEDTNMSKVFFNLNKAEAFAKVLKSQGIKTTISSALDAFNQKQYRVEW